MACHPEAKQQRRHSLGAVPLLDIPEDGISFSHQDDDMVVEIGSYQTSIFTIDSQSTERQSSAAELPRPRSAPVDSDANMTATSYLVPPLPPQD